jgi:hypothetical protein
MFEKIDVARKSAAKPATSTSGKLDSTTSASAQLRNNDKERPETSKRLQKLYLEHDPADTY